MNKNSSFRRCRAKISSLNFSLCVCVLHIGDSTCFAFTFRGITLTFTIVSRHGVRFHLAFLCHRFCLPCWERCACALHRPQSKQKNCSSSTAEGFTQILPAFSLVRFLLLLSDHKSQVQNCIVLAKIFYCPTICSEFCTTFVFCINTCGWLGKIHHLRWVIDQSTTVAISETFIYYFVCVLRAKWKYSCHLQILCSF